jgi:hypothetical protein
MTGSAVLGLERARAILRGQPGSIDALGADFVQHATAAAVLGDHYRKNPELMTAFPTGKAPREETAQECVARLAAEWRTGKVKPMTRDQIKPEYKAEWTPMGMPEAGALPVGGTLIATLPLPIGYYYIGPGPDGFGAALYAHGSASEITGVKTSVPTTDTAVVRMRDAQAAIRATENSTRSASASTWSRTISRLIHLSSPTASQRASPRDIGCFSGGGFAALPVVPCARR